MNKEEKVRKFLVLLGRGHGHEETKEEFKKSARVSYDACVKRYGKKESFQEFFERYKQNVPKFIKKELNLVHREIKSKELDVLIEFLETGLRGPLNVLLIKLFQKIDNPLNSALYKPYVGEKGCKFS